MSLIVEDGSGKTDSNTYATAEQLRAYAAARGSDIPADDESLEQLLVQAMDYLEQFTVDNPNPDIKPYKGTRTSQTQALLWPRSNVIIEDQLLGSNVIPARLKNAQMQLAIEATDFELMPSNASYAVALEQVDVIKVEYATGGRLSESTRDPAPSFPKVDALLAPLLITSKGLGLRTLRI